jgi:plasmid stabilization system protein ParE
VAPRASDEIEGALSISIERWGVAQARRYAELIAETLELLKTHAELGHARPDIHREARLMPIAKRGVRARHWLLYRIVDDVVQVARCVHGARAMEVSDDWDGPPSGS